EKLPPLTLVVRHNIQLRFSEGDGYGNIFQTIQDSIRYSKTIRGSICPHVPNDDGNDINTG
ncbi:MAG TPA: hypothetical protein VJB90_03390, partial [Candidatus Nanoarchaeia archaeon]|nr:hypothetical protein [Candidatus Nanoarchaeia archaeon]